MALPSVALLCLLRRKTQVFLVLSVNSPPHSWLSLPSDAPTFDLWPIRSLVNCCLFFLSYHFPAGSQRILQLCVFYANFTHALCIFPHFLFYPSHFSPGIFPSSTFLYLFFASVQTFPSVFDSHHRTALIGMPLFPPLAFPLLSLLLFCFSPSWTPVVSLLPLWHHPVPPTATLWHRSGAGCLGFSLSGQETARDSFTLKLRLFLLLKVPLAGVRHHSNPAPRVANLGPHWLKSASHSLPHAALCGL